MSGRWSAYDDSGFKTLLQSAIKMPQLKPGTGRYNPGGIPQRAPYTEIKDMYYNMNHRHRGLALIFNHKTFGNGPSMRRGTDKDRDRLKVVLTNLGFKVEIRNNLTYAAIYKNIQAVAKMDHSQNDCLLITVLTHGELGMLYAKDIKYSITKLWCNFTDKNCPSLAGKPKIFLLQACRGVLYDDGITLTEDIQIDGSSGVSCTPTHPDFLFAFSTTPDFYSWRNTTNGTWFIQTLCDVLIEYATDTHILTWLTFVCRKVAVEFESYTPNDVNSNSKKEMPSIYSTLTRLLVFTSNNNKEKTACCFPT